VLNAANQLLYMSYAEKTRKTRIFHIMLPLLFSCVLCLEEPEGYIELNRVMFRRYVQSRQPYQPWIVVFQNNISDKVNICTPIIEELAEKSYGYFFLGKVDVKKEPLLAHDFRIKSDWQAVLFNKDGHSFLNIPCDRTKYNRALLESIPQEVKEADPTWIESSKKKNSVILFGKAFNVPTYWKAIGAYFKKKGLRVGLCTEPEYITAFGVKRKGTTILYLNRSGSFKVPYTTDYKKLRDNIKTMNANKPLPKRIIEDRMFLSFKFKEKCTPGKICVFHAVRSIDPRFERKEIRFPDSRLIFFSGISDIPYSFIEENSIWILDGEGTKKYNVASIQELDSAIKSALSGKLAMKPINNEL
jgi:hypothetical protein